MTAIMAVERMLGGNQGNFRVNFSSSLKELRRWEPTETMDEHRHFLQSQLTRIEPKHTNATA